MPGRRLNDTERRLLKMWDNYPQQYPLLTGISIHGEPGLRGINKLDIEFNYPVTVICGKNGCGKTTLLALSALAFHAPKGHFSNQAAMLSKSGVDRAYYTFSDFFFKGPYDPDISGIIIEWKYRNCKRPNKRIVKETNKWMRYESRPGRPTDYVGVSRIIPAIELLTLRNIFKNPSVAKKNNKLLDDYFKNQLAYVAERNYENAGQLISGKYTLSSCQYRTSYTGFNMGAGEDSLMVLFSILQDIPEGSLIIIEEVELGLHPTAQRRFAEVLLKIALKKKLQIIVSSHSGEFIDAIPTLGRILLEYTGENHDVKYQCTTRYILGHITGRAFPELHIYCEDDFSAAIINQVIIGETRERVTITPIGPKAELVKQYVAHIKGKYPGKCLVVFDGDVTTSEINKWLEKAQHNNIDAVILPGNLMPEEWIIKKIVDNSDYLDKLTIFTGYENNKKQLGQYINEVNSTNDYHDISYELYERTNIDIEDLKRFLIMAIKDDNDLNLLKKTIQKKLDNHDCVGIVTS